MSKEELIRFQGIVTEKRPGTRFDIELENGHKLRAVISGKIRKFNIRINVGDRVDVDLSPYDLALGRIVYRYKD